REDLRHLVGAEHEGDERGDRADQLDRRVEQFRHGLHEWIPRERILARTARVPVGNGGWQISGARQRDADAGVGGASSVRRTSRRRPSGENGFWMKRSPGSITASRTTA